MRKVGILVRTLKLFTVPLCLIAISVACWFFIPKNVTTFKAGLVASILGVGISISAAESYRRQTHHKRLKRTFGFLKLTTVPYLLNQAENLSATLSQYDDIDSIQKAQAFAILVSNFDTIGAAFDKSWLQLVYSQDFVDAIRTDSQHYKISHAVSEVLIFTKTLAAESVIAKNLLVGDAQHFTSAQQQAYVTQVEQMRDDLKEAVGKLEQYTKELEEEVDTFLGRNGAQYEESDR
jgi:hypothetical protein